MSPRLYSVELTSAAARQLRKTDAAPRRRLLSVLAALQHDPRPPGVKKLAGEENAWRVRVGSFRVIYEIHDAALLVTVIRVGDRRDVYR